ncbi:hypothetical protein DRQ18_04260 [bacterium]|nr:MAG: hypothetical protein DRQ18_04260 [bacterium]
MRKAVLFLLPGLLLLGIQRLSPRPERILPPTGAEEVKGTVEEVEIVNPLVPTAYNYPVDTAGSTTYDWQSNGPGKQYIAVDANGGVHMVWIYSDQASNWSDRTMRYNCISDGGVWTLGKGMDGGVNVTTRRTGYGTVDYLNDGRAVVSFHGNNGTYYASSLAYDMIPYYGLFSAPYDAPDPSGVSGSPGDILWPRMAVNASEDVILFCRSYDKRHLYYTLFDINTETFTDWARVDSLVHWHNVFGSKQSDKFLLVWSRDVPSDPELDSGYIWLSHLVYQESPDGGATWNEIVDVTDLMPENTPHGFVDYREIKHCLWGGYGIYTTSDEPAMVTVGALWHGDTLYYFPWSTCVLWFYSPSSGARIVTYYPDPLWYEYDSIIGNNQIISWPTLGQDVNTGYLYVVWCEFPYNQAFGNFQSGEIYVSRSMDGGVTWSPKFNLTRSDGVCELYPSTPARIPDTTLRVFCELDLGTGSYVQGAGPLTDNPMYYMSIPIVETDLEIVGFSGFDTASFYNGDTLVPVITVRNNGPNEVVCQVRLRIDNPADKYLWYSYVTASGDTNTLILRLPTLLYESEKETIIGVGEEISVTLDTFNILKGNYAFYDTVWYANDTLFFTILEDTYGLWLPADSNHYLMEVACIGDIDISNNRIEIPGEVFEGVKRKKEEKAKFIVDREVVTEVFTGWIDMRRSGKVEIAVYDVAGRRVYGEERMVNAGRIPVRVEMDGRLPGVYLYRIKTPEGEATGRFVLVK